MKTRHIILDDILNIKNINFGILGNAVPEKGNMQLFLCISDGTKHRDENHDC